MHPGTYAQHRLLHSLRGAPVSFWETTLAGFKPVRGRHWGAYAPGTSLDRYRYCYACKSWRRFPGAKPLIHKGRKPNH